MNKLNSFAVIHNQQNWKQYKNELLTRLRQQHNDPARKFEFPEDPKEFPLLVSSFAHPRLTSVEDAFCSHKVSCCYVYLEDADRLMDSVSKLTGEVIFDENHDGQGEDLNADNEIDYAPTPTGVLLLALVVELQAIGALKREKLQAKVAEIAKWLVDNKEENIKDPGLDALLARLWESEYVD